METTERYKLNKELAQMLKGGVIMDVTTPEQARIAEEAGACAVMALERIPADIRAAGGVSGGVQRSVLFFEGIQKTHGHYPQEIRGKPERRQGGGVSYMPINRKKNCTNNNRSGGKTRVEKRAFYFAEKVV